MYVLVFDKCVSFDGLANLVFFLKSHLPFLMSVERSPFCFLRKIINVIYQNPKLALVFVIKASIKDLFFLEITYVTRHQAPYGLRSSLIKNN